VPLAAPAVSARFERHEFTLPEGWQTYGLPQPTDHECAWGRYSCHIECRDATIVCERRIEHLGGVIPPERYREFQQFWIACARGDAADIVLQSR
jgi:hypothetical protein